MSSVRSVWTRLALLGLLLALAVPATAAPEPPRRADLIAAVDAIAEAALKQGPIAGLSIAVTRGPDILLARGYGYADLEHSVPATAETVYRLGSITKQFTAAAILQLAEQGRLRLDDELTRYLPDFPTQATVSRFTTCSLILPASRVTPAWAPRFGGRVFVSTSPTMSCSPSSKMFPSTSPQTRSGPTTTPATTCWGW